MRIRRTTKRPSTLPPRRDQVLEIVGFDFVNKMNVETPNEVTKTSSEIKPRKSGTAKTDKTVVTVWNMYFERFCRNLESSIMASPPENTENYYNF